MADITNPEAVRFSNEKVRVAADKLAQAYYFAKQVSAEWTANNLGTLFPTGDDLVDGSASDGRHPLTGNDVQLLITELNTLISDLEATSNTRLNAILNVAVNVD